MENLKPLKNAYSILSLCLIGFGALLLVNPRIDEPVMYRLCGAILILFGIVKIKGYFSKDIFQLAFQFDLAMGCISILIGLILIFKTDIRLSLVSISIGIFMIIDAFLKVQTALDAKKFGIEKWYMVLLIAMIVAVSGILLMLMLFESEAGIIRLLGVNLLIDGVLNLCTVQSTVKTFRRRKREWEM